MVQPCDQSRVRVVLGAHLGQGEAGQIGKLGRLGEGHAELLYDAVQLVGFRLLELDTNLVQDKARGEVQLWLRVGKFPRHERFTLWTQSEQPEELLLAGGPFRGHDEPQDAALVLGEKQGVAFAHGLRDRVRGVIEPPLGGTGLVDPRVVVGGPALLGEALLITA